MHDEPAFRVRLTLHTHADQKRMAVDARIGMARRSGGQEMAGLECEFLVDAGHKKLYGSPVSLWVCRDRRH
jgi:hypothetical protein